MLVRNVTEVTLKCREFGVRPFDLAPGEEKDIPDVVACLWLGMTEKPIERVPEAVSYPEAEVDEEPAEDVEEDAEDEDIVDTEEDPSVIQVKARKRNR